VCVSLAIGPCVLRRPGPRLAANWPSPSSARTARCFRPQRISGTGARSLDDQTSVHQEADPGAGGRVVDGVAGAPPASYLGVPSRPPLEQPRRRRRVGNVCRGGPSTRHARALVRRTARSAACAVHCSSTGYHHLVSLGGFRTALSRPRMAICYKRFTVQRLVGGRKRTRPALDTSDWPRSDAAVTP